MGGAENVGFTKKDAVNYLQRRGDAQNLLNHFKCKQGEDPNCFYSIQVDQYNQMINFFFFGVIVHQSWIMNVLVTLYVLTLHFKQISII